MEQTEFDLSKSLEQLEGDIWPPCEFDSPVILESHKARKIPVQELSLEQLRLLVSQHLSLHILVPLAQDILWQNPMVQAKHYNGDLLCAVASLPDPFWEKHPLWFERMIDIRFMVEDLQDSIQDFVLPDTTRFIWGDPAHV